MSPPPHAIAVSGTYTRTADFVALTKPRLNLLAIATAAAGYYLGSGTPFDVVSCVNMTIGTALVAGGSAAFNQIAERRVDALMERTRWRPLAAGRLGLREASAFAAALSLGGLIWLAMTTNWLATGVALVTLVTYVGLYTPLKPKTSFATVVGAIPGALPPMIGWAAATNTLSREAWLLFGLVFLWQMPHFLAIAWLCRDDYGRAGFPMLPVIEPDGRSTAQQVAAYASALVPVSLTPAIVGLAGRAYFVIALLLGLAFLYVSLKFAMRRTRQDARTLFLASITYLPLVFMVLVIERLAYGGQAPPMLTMLSVSDLPALNATLNGISAVLLVGGYILIRQRRIEWHRRFMLSAFTTSALFLVSYVIYHANVGTRSQTFGGHGLIRYVYFAILIPHIILAMAILPMALITLSRALKRRFPRHKAIARWTLPIWLYVSVTGVIVYVMLYHM